MFLLDCQTITSNFSEETPNADFVKQAGVSCSNEAVWYSSSANQYIFYYPIPIENITGETYNETLNGWLVGPNLCSTDGVYAAAIGLRDPSQRPWEILAWFIEYDYGWDIGLIAPVRCSDCPVQDVAGTTVYPQFVGTYDRNYNPNCPVILYEQQGSGASQRYMVRQDAENGDKQWFFLEDDDPCYNTWNQTIRSPPTMDLDAHETVWDEYKADTDWWESRNLRFSCIGEITSCNAVVLRGGVRGGYALEERDGTSLSSIPLLPLMPPLPPLPQHKINAYNSIAKSKA